MMAAAAQRQQLAARRGQISRLVEPGAIAFEQLVGAQHQGSGMAPRDFQGLELGERCRRRGRAGAVGAQRFLGRRLVDRGGIDGDPEAGLLQQRRPGAAG